MMYRKLAAVFFAFAVAGAAFAKDNLAVLPFTGGTAEEGETIAELFSFNRELNEMFTPIPRTSITRAIGSEWKFQTDTGMTDPETIMAIGKRLGANYVVAGNIAKLGSQNLLTIAILKIDDLRQVAGDVQTYARIGDIRSMLTDMARNIVAATKIDASRLEKLAVTPVQLGRNIDARVADTLAQVLSANLIKSGKYAVYPRTATLEQVQAEYKNQTSGITADENIVGIGKGENPRLVLSIVARRLGDQNMFNAAIINLESGAQVVGGSVDYDSLDSGVRVMGRLARELTGTSVSLSMPTSLSLAESLAWINNNAVDGGKYTIILKNNETLDPQSLSYSGEKVGVTLDGGTVERTVSLSVDGSLFTIERGVTVTLGNNITLQGRRSNTSSLVRVNNGGTFVMGSGSKIRGNTNTSIRSGGGGVDVSGTFTMSGGTISGNSVSTGYGGGVFVSGTFTQSGGTISGNTAGFGGGVYMNGNGTFTMSGGTISGNTAPLIGGGVNVNGNGTFTMSGGTISGNNGSGVSVSGTFTMSDGTISGNSALSGGGVDVSGTFTMSGGTISGNSAASGGGGVAVGKNGTFTKQSGGVIYGSNASGTLKNTTTEGNSYGHAVYVDNSSKKRNSTAGIGVTLDSSRIGSAGGWE
ncbi:MAG: hypothetical protein LBL45_04000 [Treponema sp.]|jgi:TolB-like protein|nr:hypothetical protein [Treponema sp.]